MEGSRWISAEDRNSRDPKSTRCAAPDVARSHPTAHRSGQPDGRTADLSQRSGCGPYRVPHDIAVAGRVVPACPAHPPPRDRRRGGRRAAGRRCGLGGVASRDRAYAPRARCSPSAPARPATSRSTWTPRSTCPDDASAGRTGAGGAAGARLRRHQGVGALRRRGASPAAATRCSTWTARGFGRSGGEIHLDSPDYEVRDAQRLLDWLAARPEVRTDAPGDPRVGVVGGSYGGGLALLLAAPGPAGRRDRPDDHLERPVPRVPAGERPARRRPRACSRRAGPACSSAAAATRAPARPGSPARPPASRRAHRRRPARPAPGRAPVRAPARWRPGRCRRPVLRPVRRRRLRRVPADRHHRPGRRRPPSTCCAGPARPACWTGSRRRRC